MTYKKKSQEKTPQELGYEYEHKVINWLKNKWNSNGHELVEQSKENNTRGADGGHDARATFQIPSLFIGAEIPSPTIWIEIKYRSSDNLNVHALGGHYCKAIHQRVYAIYFVSNRKFTDECRDILGGIGRGWGYSIFIEEFEPGDHDGVASDVPAISGSQAQESSPLLLELGVRFRRSPEPSLSAAHIGNVTVPLGTPVYIEIEALCHGSASRSIPENGFETTTITLSHPQCHDKHSISIPVIPSGGRLVFHHAYVPTQLGKQSSSDFHIKGGSDAETDIPIKLNTHSCGDNTLVIEHSELGDWVPRSRSKYVDELTNSLSTWLQGTSPFVFGIEAAEGEGKSYTLNKLRCVWLQKGAKEIMLDCSESGDVASILQNVFEKTSPLHPNLRTILKKNLPKVVDTPGGMTTSEKMLWDMLLLPEFSSRNNDQYSVDDAANVLLRMISFLLPQHAPAQDPGGRTLQPQKVVLAIEDIHYASHEVFELLDAVHMKISNVDDFPLLIVVTSRPYTQSKPFSRALSEKFQKDMIHCEVSNALRLAHWIRLPSIDVNDAITLLTTRIEGLSRNLAQQIVEQVGTTPYNLVHAFSHMRWRRIIATVPDGRALFLGDTSLLDIQHELVAPEILQESILHGAFRNPAQSTYRGICKAYGQRLRLLAKVLSAAACVNMEFYPDRLLEFITDTPAPAEAVEEFWHGLDKCKEFNILRRGTSGGGAVTFSHDLVRHVVLERMPSGEQRIAADHLYSSSLETYFPMYPTGKLQGEVTRLSLALQAEKHVEGAELATRLLAHAEKENAHSTALQLQMLLLLSTPSFQLCPVDFLEIPLFRWDIAVRERPSFYLQTSPDTALQWCINALNIASRMSSLGMEWVRALINIAAMEATTLKDKDESERIAANLHYFDGRHSFDNNDFISAEEYFTTASEKMLPFLNEKQDESREHLDTLIKCPDEQFESSLSTFVQYEKMHADSKDGESGKLSYNLPATLFMYKSFAERHLGQIEESRRSMESAVTCRQRGDFSLVRQVLANYGAYSMLSNVSETETYWKRGLRASEAMKEELHQAHFELNMAHIAILKDDHDAVRHHLSKGLAISEQLGLHQEVIRYWVLSGCHLMATGDLAKAETHFLTALEKAINMRHERKLWRIHANLATIAELQGDLERCAEFDMKTLEGVGDLILDQDSWLSSRAVFPVFNAIERAIDHGQPMPSERLPRPNASSVGVPGDKNDQMKEIERRYAAKKDELLLSDISFFQKRVQGIRRFIVTN